MLHSPSTSESSEGDREWNASCAEVTEKLSLLLATLGIDYSCLTRKDEKIKVGDNAPDPKALEESKLAKEKEGNGLKERRARKPRSASRESFKAGSESDALLVEMTERHRAHIEELEKGHEEALRQAHELSEKQIRVLRDKGIQQSKRSQQLLEKIRKLEGENELATKERNSALEDNRLFRDKGMHQSKRSQQLLEKIRKLERENELAVKEKNVALEDHLQVSQQVEQLKLRLKSYKDRYTDESKRSSQSTEALEKCKARIHKLVQCEKGENHRNSWEALLEEGLKHSRKTFHFFPFVDLQDKLSTTGKELSMVKSTLTKETSLRKKTQHQVTTLENQNKELTASLAKAQERIKKYDSQRDKMFRVVKHLKHINKELMSVLLAERAANEKTLSMDDTDNPSLLPQAVRLAKEEVGAGVDHNGKEKRKEKLIEEEDNESESQDIDFYKNLKQRYQEAKATYRSLLSKD